MSSVSAAKGGLLGALREADELFRLLEADALEREAGGSHGRAGDAGSPLSVVARALFRTPDAGDVVAKRRPLGAETMGRDSRDSDAASQVIDRAEKVVQEHACLRCVNPHAAPTILRAKPSQLVRADESELSLRLLERHRALSDSAAGIFPPNFSPAASGGASRSSSNSPSHHELTHLAQYMSAKVKEERGGSVSMNLGGAAPEWARQAYICNICTMQARYSGCPDTKAQKLLSQVLCSWKEYACQRASSNGTRDQVLEEAVAVLAAAAEQEGKRLVQTLADSVHRDAVRRAAQVEAATCYRARHLSALAFAGFEAGMIRARQAHAGALALNNRREHVLVWKWWVRAVRAFGVACEAHDRAEQRRLKLEALVKGFATTRRCSSTAPPSERQDTGCRALEDRALEQRALDQALCEGCSSRAQDVQGCQDSQNLPPSACAPQQECALSPKRLSGNNLGLGNKLVLRTQDPAVLTRQLRGLEPQPSDSHSAHAHLHTHTQPVAEASDHASQCGSRTVCRTWANELDTVADSGAQAAHAHERGACGQSAATCRGAGRADARAARADGSRPQSPPNISTPRSGERVRGSSTSGQEVGLGGGHMRPQGAGRSSRSSSQDPAAASTTGSSSRHIGTSLEPHWSHTSLEPHWSHIGATAQTRGCIQEAPLEASEPTPLEPAFKCSGTPKCSPVPAPSSWHKNVIAMEARQMERAAKRRALQEKYAEIERARQQAERRLQDQASAQLKALEQARLEKLQQHQQHEWQLAIQRQLNLHLHEEKRRLGELHWTKQRLRFAMRSWSDAIRALSHFLCRWQRQRKKRKGVAALARHASRQRAYAAASEATASRRARLMQQHCLARFTLRGWMWSLTSGHEVARALCCRRSYHELQFVLEAWRNYAAYRVAARTARQVEHMQVVQQRHADVVTRAACRHWLEAVSSARQERARLEFRTKLKSTAMNAIRSLQRDLSPISPPSPPLSLP